MKTAAAMLLITMKSSLINCENAIEAAANRGQGFVRFYNSLGMQGMPDAYHDCLGSKEALAKKGYFVQVEATPKFAGDEWTRELFISWELKEVKK